MVYVTYIRNFGLSVQLHPSNKRHNFLLSYVEFVILIYRKWKLSRWKISKLSLLNYTVMPNVTQIKNAVESLIQILIFIPFEWTVLFVNLPLDLLNFQVKSFMIFEKKICRFYKNWFIDLFWRHLNWKI